MGLYMYITENDRVKMREVKDKSLDEIFQEAFLHDKSLMISETIHLQKTGFFSKPKEVSTYSIYHDCDPENHPYQARQQLSASGDKDIIYAYLFGIINGSEKAKQKYLYDFSKACKCGESSTGETWCCNVCGLPTVSKTVL